MVFSFIFTPKKKAFSSFVTFSNDQTAINLGWGRSFIECSRVFSKFSKLQISLGRINIVQIMIFDIFFTRWSIPLVVYCDSPLPSQWMSFACQSSARSCDTLAKTVLNWADITLMTNTNLLNHFMLWVSLFIVKFTDRLSTGGISRDIDSKKMFGLIDFLRFTKKSPVYWFNVLAALVTMSTTVTNTYIAIFKSLDRLPWLVVDSVTHSLNSYFGLISGHFLIEIKFTFKLILN